MLHLTHGTFKDLMPLTAQYIRILYNIILTVDVVLGENGDTCVGRLGDFEMCLLSGRSPQVGPVELEKLVAAPQTLWTAGTTVW